MTLIDISFRTPEKTDVDSPGRLISTGIDDDFTESYPQILRKRPFFSGVDRIQPNWPDQAECHIPVFKVIKVGSPLAFNLARTGSRTRGRETLFKALELSVPRGSHVMLIFGEIDCRAHVLKQAKVRGVTVSEVVKELLDSYFSVIKEVIAMGHTVIVYNAIPSRIKASTKSRQDPDYIAIGSCLERNAATRLFNQGLATRCRENGIYFLSTFDALVDAEGLTNTWYYFDTIHLSQRAMPVALNALRGIFPEWGMRKLEVVVPSQMDRFVDRVTKRIRRLAKISVPLRRSSFAK
jgi:hypothetical protein